MTIAIGMNEEGYREILDIDINYEELNTSYEAFFYLLKERGAEKIDFVISNDHKGIKRATVHSFVGSICQLCTVYFKKNLLKVVPQKD